MHVALERCLTIIVIIDTEFTVAGNAITRILNIQVSVIILTNYSRRAIQKLTICCLKSCDRSLHLIKVFIIILKTKS